MHDLSAARLLKIYVNYFQCLQLTLPSILFTILVTMKSVKSSSHATLKDVAERSGVSIASVSRVINNISPVSDALREKVEAAVKELNYEKRKFTENSTKTILMLNSDMLNPYFNELCSFFSEYASSMKVTPFIYDLHRNGRNIISRIGEALSFDILGCIILGPAIPSDEIIGFVNLLQKPVVVVNQILQQKHKLIRSVNFDYTRATKNATKHLINLGHRKIAYMGASSHSVVNEKKLEGVKLALAESDISIPVNTSLYGPPTIAWGFTAARKLLGMAEKERPTGIICDCDLVALGVLHAVRSIGSYVPKEFSVIGIDDIDMACHSNPPLTTISPPKRELARLATDILLSSYNSFENFSDYLMVECPLIVRGSTDFCCETRHGAETRQ